MGRRPEFDVVFYAPWIGPLLVAGSEVSTGGAETQILMLARELARRGRRVAVISYPTDPPLPKQVDGVQIVAQRRLLGLPRGLRPPAFLVEMARVLCGVDAAACVQRAAGATTGVVGLLTRLRGRRFIYSSASVLDFDYRRRATGRADLWIYHLGVRLADRIVVQSPEQVGLCERRFGRSPVMIKSLAAPAAAREGMPAAFLWIGRAAHYKRPEVYVELARAVPEAHFWMIAAPANTRSDMLPALRQAAAEVSNLELLAPRPRAELGELIDRAVAIVNTTDYEGMPNVFLEGWARGVPALALSHDPDGVLARERVGAFADGSRERLVEAARAMWRDRGDQSEVARRCRDYIEREHSPGPVVDAWERALGLTPGRDPLGPRPTSRPSHRHVDCHTGHGGAVPRPGERRADPHES